MKMTQAGYSFVPQKVFQKQLADYARDGIYRDEPPPSIARPVFVDDQGRHFIADLEEDADVAPVPFDLPETSNSLSDESLNRLGGFVPMDQMPSRPVQDSELEHAMGKILQQMPAQMAVDWVGRAAQNLMAGAGPGGLMDATLGILGVKNPLASGPLAGLASGALGAAGLGALGGSLPALGGLLTGGDATGLAQSIGGGTLGSILDSVGLEGIGGGSLDDLAAIMTNGGFSGELDGIAEQMNILPGGCTTPDGQDTKGPSLDAASISGEALDQAADYLANQWNVDDESSAAEHVAHKAFNQYKDEIQKALKEELQSAISGTATKGGLSGLVNRVKALFTGYPAGCGLPAIRIGDPDDKGDVSVEGIMPIRIKGRPVSRVSDKVAGAMAPMPGKQIALGEPSVLSANLPTAFHGVVTAVPSIMQPGACTVLVGGAVAAAVKKAMAAQAAAKCNAPPDAPDGPGDTDSSSDKRPDSNKNDPEKSDTSKNPPTKEKDGQSDNSGKPENEENKTEEKPKKDASGLTPEDYEKFEEKLKEVKQEERDQRELEERKKLEEELLRDDDPVDESDPERIKLRQELEDYAEYGDAKVERHRIGDREVTIVEGDDYKKTIIQYDDGRRTQTTETVLNEFTEDGWFFDSQHSQIGVERVEWPEGSTEYTDQNNSGIQYQLIHREDMEIVDGVYRRTEVGAEGHGSMGGGFDAGIGVGGKTGLLVKTDNGNEHYVSGGLSAGLQANLQFDTYGDDDYRVNTSAKLGPFGGGVQSSKEGFTRGDQLSIGPYSVSVESSYQPPHSDNASNE